MPLLAELAGRLVCPKTREPLEHIEERRLLYARKARLSYRIEEGTPVLLVEEAREVSAEEEGDLEALLEAARRASSRP